MVECKVCGEEFERITQSHLSTHDMTMDEYEGFKEKEEMTVEVEEFEVEKIEVEVRDNCHLVSVSSGEGEESFTIPKQNREGVIVRLMDRCDLTREEVLDLLRFK